MLDFNRILRDLQEPSAELPPIRLRDALAEQLTDGSLNPGEPFPSATVLQEHLKIGPDLIQKVLNELTGSGLLQPGDGDELYLLTPPLAAPTHAPHIKVGLLAGISAFHFFYGHLAAALNLRMQEAGGNFQMALYHDQLAPLQATAQSMLREQVRAFAINAPQFNIQPVLDDLRAHGAVVQLLGTGIYYPEYDFIGADNQQIGYQATRHLLELGHTQIIYAGAASYPAIYDRTTGYVKAMQAAGLRPRIFNVHSLRETTLPPDLQPYLDRENTPTALWRDMVRRRITAAFCFNYVEGAWMYDEMLKFNLQVPRDISLITVGNPPTLGYRGAMLTTFALPGQAIGRQAADLILRRLGGEDFPPQKIFLPGDLILHASTRAARG